MWPSQNIWTLYYNTQGHHTQISRRDSLLLEIEAKPSPLKDLELLMMWSDYLSPTRFFPWYTVSEGRVFWPLFFEINFGLMGWPPQPPREKMLKINKIADFWWSISQNKLLSFMFPSTMAPKRPIFASQCEMDHQKSTILWIFDTLSVWGCGGHGCYFQPNPRVISQNSASHKCTDSVFMT